MANVCMFGRVYGRRLMGMAVVLLFVAGCGLLAGCTSSPKPQGLPLAAMTFAHLEPMRLSAFTVHKSVEPEQNSSLSGYFSERPSVLIKRYLDQRFVAAGGAQDGTVSLRVPQIRLEQEQISTYKPSIFWERKTYRFDVFVDVTMSYRDQSGNNKSLAMTLRRSTVLDDGMTVSRREEELQILMEELFIDLDKQINDRIGLIMAYLPSFE